MPAAVFDEHKRAIEQTNWRQVRAMRIAVLALGAISFLPGRAHGQAGVDVRELSQRVKMPLATLRSAVMRAIP